MQFPAANFCGGCFFWDNLKTEVETSQQWNANFLPDKIVHGTKSDEILDSWKVEYGQDHHGDEVRCRLVATQLANGERLDVTQSTPNVGKAFIVDCIAAC